MKIEVLVTTMHQKDFSKYKEMNLQTDAVIANQAEHDSKESAVINEKQIKLITTNTRGVSLNRNIAISNAQADIVVFSDDDQFFVDGYEQVIINAFEEFPDADAIKFYCKSNNPQRPLSFKRVSKICIATRKNIMSAGVNGLAIKRSFLQSHQIMFDEEIGPGREIYCGEDSVFLNDLIKKKAKIYLSPTLISYVSQDESSWFDGYNERFFLSAGYIYAKIYGLLSPLVIIRRTIKSKKTKKCTASYARIFIWMIRGFVRGWKHR